MKTTPISVTEAPRNFADCVNRVRYQNMTFVLLKNGTPIARLVPKGEKVRLGRDLASVLPKVEMPADEAVDWNATLRKLGSV